MMPFVFSHNPSFYNLEGADETRIVVQPVIPFQTGALRHIARITLPYVAAGPDWGLLAEGQASDAAPPNYVPTADRTGLGDTALFDLLIFPAPWRGGRIAAGLSAILPTSTDPALGTGKWSAGPAFGGLVQSGNLLAGGILLANFSFAGHGGRDDVGVVVFQPFASYGVGRGWSLELSEMNLNHDVESGRWTNLPLGVRIGKLAAIGQVPVRFYADAERNLADHGVAPEWTFRFAIVPLL